MKTSFFSLLILIWLSSLINISNASNYSCSWTNNIQGSVYIWQNTVNLTNSWDTLSCNKWLNKITINTLNWNDTINTLVSDKIWTTINLWNWDDTFNQIINKWVFSNWTINWWTWIDKLVLDRPSSDLIISWDCSISCKISVKNQWGGPFWKFKNVTLKSIEKIQALDWILPIKQKVITIKKFPLIIPTWKSVRQYTKDIRSYSTKNTILEINPWNIFSTNWDSNMYYDNLSWKTTYIQDFKNITIKNTAWYVLGYPEIYVWNKPWNKDYIQWTSLLPEKLSNINSLNVKSIWNLNHTRTLPTNFSMEWWFTKKKFEQSKVGSWEVEMMIMWYKNILWWAWTKIWQTIIPIIFNWKSVNITFDIYLQNKWWDFITFIPHNSQDFKKWNLDFNVKDFTKVAKRYVPQISKLYLEDWEFWTEYWTPNTKTAKLSWEISKFNVTWQLKLKNIPLKNTYITWTWVIF